MNNSLQSRTAPNRNLDFDILRIVSILAVIFLHVAAESWHRATPSLGWEVRNIYDAAVRWGVPVFVMISGSLFLDSRKHVEIGKLYKKNISCIVIAYFFWAIVYQLYKSIGKDCSIGWFVGEVFEGCVHIWFLIMLVGLYIAIPILRVVVSDKRTEEYFLIVAFVTSFLIPLVFPLIGHVNMNLQNIMQTFYEKLSIKIAAGFTGYFVLGHYLTNYPLNRRQKSVTVVLALLSYVLVVIMTSCSFHLTGVPHEKFYGNLTPFTMFEAVAVFSISNGVGCKKFVVKNQSLVLRLSKWSFGVYLIHILVKYVLRDYAGFGSYSFNSVVSVPVMTLLVFVLSNLIVWLFNIIIPRVIRDKVM